MTDAPFKAFEKSANATVRRLNAENTWLRHTMMEMENRVEAMVKHLTGIDARVKVLKKQLPPAPAKTATKSRSKK